jgi:hypothetical protein
MSIYIQKQIKDNANDIRSFVGDLHKWEGEHEENAKTKKKL